MAVVSAEGDEEAAGIGVVFEVQADGLESSLLKAGEAHHSASSFVEQVYLLTFFQL